MRHFLQGVLVTLAAAATAMAVIWFIVLPRFDWGANQDPGVVEEALANDSLRRWVRSRTDSSTNPFAPTAENLKAAEVEYKEHCAACHGLDGSGSNRFEAHFYPPVPKLTGDAQKLSDAEIYFIIANGIAYTAMPAFGRNHSTDDIWRLVLWVRHLGNLSPQEKADITREMQGQGEEHEKTMSH
jgi:mono/diheme cytochrome c family protein